MLVERFVLTEIKTIKKLTFAQSRWAMIDVWLTYISPYGRLDNSLSGETNIMRIIMLSKHADRRSTADIFAMLRTESLQLLRK